MAAAAAAVKDGPVEVSPVNIGFTYEIKGKVQGVFFRKYTKAKADELKIVGWVRNTVRGTVEGEAQSTNRESLSKLMVWLRDIGSPKSSITGSTFSDIS